MQCSKSTEEENSLTSRAHGEKFTAYVIKDEVSACVLSGFIYVPLYYMSCKDKKIIELVANFMAQRGVADTFLTRGSINCSFCCFRTGEANL